MFKIKYDFTVEDGKNHYGYVGDGFEVSTYYSDYINRNDRWYVYYNGQTVFKSKDEQEARNLVDYINKEHDIYLNHEVKSETIDISKYREKYDKMFYKTCHETLEHINEVNR